MAQNQHLIVVLLTLTLAHYSCGSAKKIKVNRAKSSFNSNESNKNLPIKNEKLLKTNKKFTVAQKIDLYVKTYAEVAQHEMKYFNIPASITLAQGILESGIGGSRLATMANNHFGIKCHKEWNGKKIYHNDDEIGECFRAYNDPRQSYRDHSLFLTTRSRYNFLFEIKKSDYKSWARGLKKAGYATDPKYPNKLISLIERYRLDRYDLINRKLNKEAVSMAKNIYQIVHQVEKGDTLFSIAKKYKVDLHLIVKENRIKNNTIFLGQNLIIPQAQ